MTWHIDSTTLRLYASDELAGSASASVEAHLLDCERCRADLAALTDPAQLAASWEGVERAITRPDPAAAPGPAPLAGWGATHRPRLSVALAATLVLTMGIARLAGAGLSGSPVVAAPEPTHTAFPDPRAPNLDVLVLPPRPSPSPEPSPPPPARSSSEVRAAAAALVPFDACTSLRDHLRAEGGQRVTAWGLPGAHRWGSDLSTPVADSAQGGGTTTGGTTGAGTTGGDGGAVGGDSTPGYSETNVQEEGIDEPDTVETDGRHAFIARDDRITIVRVDGDAPIEVAEVVLGGEVGGAQLLLDGARLLVLSHGWGQPVDDRVEPAHGYGSDARRTQVRLVDVADPARPVVVHRATVDGWLVNARSIGGSARVVVHSDPARLPFVRPDHDGHSEEEALAHNRRVVAESTVDQWVPQVTIQQGAGTPQARTLTACESTHRPPVFSGFGSLSVLTFDIHGDLGDLHSTSVLADGDTVYASSRTLYVATTRWHDPSQSEPAPDVTTQLHAFDITDPGCAGYVASGVVTGHLLNQFALSEHEGFLRVATTEGSPGVRASVSSVRVLERRDDLLLPVGEVTGLGQGERIYAVRFLGAVGYVVTFRQIDPLYTLDLSDPSAPRVVGELKITGYSAYLHPTTPGRLLGIGREATEDGRATGMQLSLFDVSDLASPQRLSQVVLEDGSSEAEYDHHAFLYWPATGLVMVPTSTWSHEEDGWWSGAVGFRLEGDMLTRLGRVSHAERGHQNDGGHQRIQRSFVVGDTVYTVSHAGILGSDVHTLEDRGWLPFPS